VHHTGYIGRYLARRLALFLLTLITAATINFLILHLSPVDPIAAVLSRLSGRGTSVEGGARLVALYTHTFALDRSLPVQYLIYLKNLVHGDLGYSLSYFPERVSAVVGRALPWSLGLLGSAVLLAFVLGNMLGALATWPSAPRVFQALMLLFMSFAAIPSYLLALILLYLFGYLWPILPLGGSFTPGSARSFNFATLFDIAQHALLPLLSITLGLIGFWALSMRGVMTTLVGEDYLGYARLKGLRERTIFLRYGMRNALLPQVTALAIDLGLLLSGQVVVETIYSYPGIGTVLFNALRTADYFVIQGVVLFIIVAVAVVMLLVDLLYPLLDPRVRLQ
jgi:peptide/nickel transport system permease protein